MANKDNPSNLSPTVLHVIEQFANTMREDDGIENPVIDRLEKVLRKGSIPKPDEIYIALFEPPQKEKHDSH
jgi:hypothetical protein